MPCFTALNFRTLLCSCQTVHNSRTLSFNPLTTALNSKSTLHVVKQLGARTLLFKHLSTVPNSRTRLKPLLNRSGLPDLAFQAFVKTVQVLTAQEFPSDVASYGDWARFLFLWLLELCASCLCFTVLNFQTSLCKLLNSSRLPSPIV